MKTIIITKVLGWKSCDLEFLENKINELNLNIDDILAELKINFLDKTDINSWIYYTFYLGADKFLDRVEKFAQENKIKFIRFMIDIEIYIDYRDSFLNGEILNSDINIADFSDDNLKSFIDKVIEA